MRLVRILDTRSARTSAVGTAGMLTVLTILARPKDLISWTVRSDVIPNVLFFLKRKIGQGFDGLVVIAINFTKIRPYPS